jgi:uncharacterized protein DUF6801
MKIRAFLVLAAAATAVLTGAAAPAAAATTYTAGPVGYRCTLPGIPAQTFPLAATFTGPDTVAAGATFTITDISGSLTLSPSLHSIFTAWGYDGVRGSGAVPVTAQNATPAGSGGGTVPEKIWAPLGTVTIDLVGGTQSFVAGAAGVLTFSTGTPITPALQFHRASNGTWANWTMSCTPNSGEPRTFSPVLPIL